MGNLNNLYISQSFQSLAHLGTDNALVPGQMTILQDGIGQSLNISFDGTNISSSGNILAANIKQVDTSSFVTTASFNAYSQSTSTTITNLSASLTVTDKFLQDQITALDVSGAAVSLVLFNQFTASQLLINSDYNSFTQSADIRLDNLETTSASVNVSIANLTSKTGSYATTGSNTFIGNQTINGNVNLTGSLTASGLRYPTTDGAFTGQTLQTNAAGTLSFNNVTTLYETIRNGEATQLTKGTAVYISGSQGDTPIVYRADANDPLKMPVTFVVAEAIASNTVGRGITLGLLSGYSTVEAVGTLLYANGNGTLTSTKPTGSNAIIQPIGVITKSGSGGILNILNPGPASLPNIQNGYLWVGDATNQPIQIATSSLVPNINTGSFATTGSNTFTGQQTIQDNGIGVYGQFPSIALQANVEGSGSQYPSVGMVIDTNAYPTDYFGGYAINSSNDNFGFALSSYNANGDLSYIMYGPGIGNNINYGSPDDVVLQMFETSNNLFIKRDTVLSGSLNVSGSGRFIGTQVITGSLLISGSATNDLTVVGQIYVSSSATGGTTAPRITVSGSQGQTLINRNSISTRNLTHTANLLPSTTFVSNLTTLDEVGFTIDPTVIGIPNWSQGGAIYVNNTAGDTYPAVFGFQNKANYTDGRVAVLTPLSASAGFTASLQNGYAWVGNSAGRNTQVPTSSFAGATIDTGSFATTGSNTFVGQQIVDNANVNILGQYASLTIAANLNNSGSQYPGATIFIDPALYSNDGVFGGYTVTDSNTNTSIVSIAANAYTPFGPETVGGLFGGGQNQAGSDAAIILRTGSADMYVLKPTSFSYDVNITGSLTASLQQGYVWVGNANGKTTTVATSSFGGGTTIDTGSFATTGSNQFNGNQTITGSVIVSGSFQTTQDITIWDASDNPTLKIGRGGGNQPSNLRFGVQALPSNTTANFNIAIGNSAMHYTSASTAGSNIAIGNQALQYNQGEQNVAMGINALRFTTSGSNNFGLGSYSLESNTVGNENVALGTGALNKNVAGSRNVALGGGALFGSVGGDFNIAIGYNTGEILSGSYNTLVGYRAASNFSGSKNVFIGGYQGGGQTLNNNIILSDGDGNIKLQSSSSVWNTTDSFIVSSSFSVASDIKMGKGTNKPCDIVTVGSSGLVVSNSLATTNSIILVTTQNSDVAGDEYPAVVSSKSSGQFTINHNYGGNLSVAYLIINPF